MSTALAALVLALGMYQILLFARIVFSFILNYSREWRPKAFPAAVIEIIWMLTDPPVTFVRRIVPPVKIGSIQLDLSILILLMVISISISALRSFI